MSKLRDKMLRGEKPTGSVEDLAEWLILRKEWYEQATGKKYEETSS
jgi:hypothetical protein